MTEFEWNPSYENILQRIASEDIVEVEWSKLRDIIKYKLNENVSLFMSAKPSPPPSFSPQPLAHGGLKLPPFPPRMRDESNVNEAPISFMNDTQADHMKNAVYAELNEFEEHPPFTIQRLCELCIRPNQHYHSVGKYLRAVEKTLLVTSTMDAFPPLSEAAKDPFVTTYSTVNYAPHTPSTPLFSPIPFLHLDARRSKSLSPPPSPLLLGSRVTSIAHDEPKALGLVDELDDPSPGHLSDRPTAISSVTKVPSRPLLASLEQRFVRAKSGESEGANK